MGRELSSANIGDGEDQEGIVAQGHLVWKFPHFRRDVVCQKVARIESEDSEDDVEEVDSLIHEEAVFIRVCSVGYLEEEEIEAAQGHEAH